jgi:hypothetical protein
MRAITISTALGTALLIAGCGGGTKPQNPANSGGGPRGNGAQAAYRFSACMRNHGVSNFPDPVVHSSAGSQSVGIKVDPSITGSPAFTSAQKACQSILPTASPSQQASNDRAKEEHLLAFARCMRAHGITSFPDPDPQGNIRPDRLSAAGVDLQSPAVQKAAYTCAPTSGGVVTPALIHQAVSGGGG